MIYTNPINTDPNNNVFISWVSLVVKSAIVACIAYIDATIVFSNFLIFFCFSESLLYSIYRERVNRCFVLSPRVYVL